MCLQHFFHCRVRDIAPQIGQGHLECPQVNGCLCFSLKVVDFAGYELGKTRLYAHVLPAFNFYPVRGISGYRRRSLYVSGPWRTLHIAANEHLVSKLTLYGGFATASISRGLQDKHVSMDRMSASSVFEQFKKHRVRISLPSRWVASSASS